jgi:hypothetical protein
MVHQGIEGRYVRPWSLNLLFCRRGFGLVVSVVVPSMLAVLPHGEVDLLITVDRLFGFFCFEHSCRWRQFIISNT